MHTTPPNPSRPRRERSRGGRLVLLTALLLGGAGCRAITRNPYDKIEAELRTRERELAEARGELEGARLLNDAYARTPRAPAPDDARGAPFLPLKEIVLGSGTGGADNDNQPGDEALQVVVVPRDADLSAVKVPANVVVFAYEVAKNGTKTAIGRWDVSPDTLRRNWRSGLFATGYYLTLQWDQLPAYERLRVVVRLRTLDGREFEAEREVAVRVVPGGGAGLREDCLPPVAVPRVPPAIVPRSPMIEVLPLPTEVKANRPATISPARSGEK
jgi:hypothetical protein